MSVVRHLYVPPLEQLSGVLQNALNKNFAKSKVSVITCPDLTQPPFSLAAAGLSGNVALADVGGQLNMHYKANHNKFHFDIKNISEEINGPFFIGAGATKPSISFKRDNSELMPNLNITSNVNLSKEAYVAKDGSGHLVDYPSTEFSGLANFFVSEGKPGTVIKIEAHGRTGKQNIVTCMRQALLDHYGKDKQIGLGGVLLVKKGKIRSHIMPGFPPCDVAGTNIEWLKYFEVEAPLTCYSVFVSADTHNDELRLEHTHFVSTHNDGGHYHYDTTPEEIYYEGYYNVATKLYRIGRATAPNNSKL